MIHHTILLPFLPPTHPLPLLRHSLNFRFGVPFCTYIRERIMSNGDKSGNKLYYLVMLIFGKKKGGSGGSFARILGGFVSNQQVLRS